MTRQLPDISVCQVCNNDCLRHVYHASDTAYLQLGLKFLAEHDAMDTYRLASISIGIGSRIGPFVFMKDYEHDGSDGNVMNKDAT